MPTIQHSPFSRTLRRGALLAAALLGLAPALAHGEMLLRPAVVVDNDIVRLGDLFDGAGSKADTPVARAPAAGKRVTLSADWLQMVARNAGADWRPASAIDQSVLERAGITVTHDQIVAELKTALVGQSIDETAEIELTNRELQLTVPGSGAANLGIRDLIYDSRFKRFTATVEIPAGQPNASRVRVSGRVFPTIAVPVMAHAIGRGEVVSMADLVWQRQREEQVRRDIVLEPAQIIGQASRQGLRSGQMISASDLQKPVVVAKGAIVIILLQAGSMSLSAQGRAVEQGSIGDMIHVTNIRSNMTIEARVEGPNQVRVSTDGRTVALVN